MTTWELFFMGAIAFCATAILGQALPREFASKPQRIASGAAQNEVRIFHIGANAYRVTLDYADISDSAEWNPPLALPLGFDKIEKIARQELRKLTPGDSRWEVTNVGLNRLRETVFQSLLPYRASRERWSFKVWCNDERA